MLHQLTPPWLFQVANTAALLGWIWLLVWLILPDTLRQKTRMVGLLLPLLLGVLYAAAMLTYFNVSNGGFDTLENVMSLFTRPGMVLAGWVHYLAFDLFVGWCISRDAVNRRINRLLIIPCLVLTLLFGPVGLLLYAAVRLAQHFVRAAPDAA